MILNPHDAQGMQIADSIGIYPTVRGCGGGGYQQGYLLQRNVAVKYKYYSQLRTDEYKEDKVATTLAARDFKSATDLVKGGDGMNAVVRRLTPL